MQRVAPSADGALVADSVTFGYEAPVLHGVDLRVEAGHCVALLGANGAGKTTLLRLLGGLVAPQRGSVQLNGHDVSRITAATRARSIGYLPQRIPPAAGFSVHEMVLMGLYALLPASGWESRSDWLAVGRALRRVKATHLLRRRFDELSGGEQRRVLLARTLVAQPANLLLDEPMAALDPGFALELEATLGGLKRQGVSLVLSTHHLGLARRLADRVVLLHRGSVLLDERPEVAMQPGWLGRTYDTQHFSAAASAQRMPG